jgi:hypothetical protein
MPSLITNSKELKQIASGTNISSHYLKDERAFKIVRQNQTVYAIQLGNDGEAKNAVEMWKSHNKELTKENQTAHEHLGKGKLGSVFEKTPDKAVKTFRFLQEQSAALENNEKILQQKFSLAKLGLDSIFVFGLHNVKHAESGTITFNMPKLNVITGFAPDGRASMKENLDDAYQEKLEQIYLNIEKS